MKNAGMATITSGKTCSTSGCENPAAFRTRTKPAWCLDCIDQILLTAGLKACEQFGGPNEWRLTSCIECGVQAHYRLSYSVELNASGEKTCRACHWKDWTALHGHGTSGKVYSREDAAAYAGNNGYELVSLITDTTRTDDPVVVHCRSCGKISAARISDLGWGCACTRNTRSFAPTAAAASGQTQSGISKRFLFESDDPALAWWDHERNEEKALRTVTLRASRVCHWKCPECSHPFDEKVLYMTGGSPRCPDCATRRQEEWGSQYEAWKTTPISAVPELAADWADEDDPRTVMVAPPRLCRFKCARGHFPRISPISYLNSGCPSCRAAETRKTQKNWLADVLPEIASQWHPERNGRLTPETVVWDSKRTVWWLAGCCGCEWQESPRNRDKYQRLRCPQCKTILGSLAWQDPGLAAEWSPANPVSALHVRPTATIGFTPEWICATNPAHVWSSPLASRSAGAGCPECSEAGKSKVELEHFAAAKKVFSSVRSGAVLRSPEFTTRKRWTADIKATAAGMELIIEYDGEYWHRAPAKLIVDERKSRDLLAAGYAVVRLREDDLPPVPIADPRYREIRVYSAAPRPEAVMAGISTWAAQLRD